MPDRPCLQCGGLIEGNDRFCGGCGAPAAASPATVAAAAPTIPAPVPPTPAIRSTPPWANLSRPALGGIAALVVAAIVGGAIMLTNSDKGETPSTTPATVQTSPNTATGATAATSTTGADLPVGVPYSAYESVTDDSGILTMSVPVEWGDRSGAAWTPSTDGVPIGPGLHAATNRVAWTEGWSTPGVFFGASAELGVTADGLLDQLSFHEFCNFESRDDYDDGLYRGKVATWVDCGDAGSGFVQIATEPYEGGALMLVEVTIVTQADLEALQKIVESFQMTSGLGG